LSDSDVQRKMFFKVELIDGLVVLSDESNENKLEFPVIWLRDNCQCSACFDPQTYTRLIDWDTFDFNLQLNAIEVSTKFSYE
jgi:Gamma-butyrobetaine hydroxylase-like, N-terminal